MCYACTEEERLEDMCDHETILGWYLDRKEPIIFDLYSYEYDEHNEPTSIWIPTDKNESIPYWKTNTDITCADCNMNWLHRFSEFYYLIPTTLNGIQVFKKIQKTKQEVIQIVKERENK